MGMTGTTRSHESLIAELEQLRTRVAELEVPSARLPSRLVGREVNSHMIAAIFRQLLVERVKPETLLLWTGVTAEWASARRKRISWDDYSVLMTNVTKFWSLEHTREFAFGNPDLGEFRVVKAAAQLAVDPMTVIGGRLGGGHWTSPCKLSVITLRRMSNETCALSPRFATSRAFGGSFGSARVGSDNW